MRFFPLVFDLKWIRKVEKKNGIAAQPVERSTPKSNQYQFKSKQNLI